MNKRLLSALLALCMMITLFPAAAFASADDAGGGIHPLTPAAQDTSPDEENGSGNVTTVSTEADLRAVFEQNESSQSTSSVTLADNIELTAPLTLQKGTVTVNGNGHVLIAANNFSEDSLIVVNNGATLNLNACTLDGGNKCRILYIGSNDAHPRDASVYLSGSTIQNGSAENGGGVYLDGRAVEEYNKRAALYMKNSAITQCTATLNGGGVYYSGASSVVPQTLHNDSITNCSAQKGGGLYLSGSFYSDDTGDTGLMIKDCHAAVSGGGIYIDETARGSLGLANALIYDNTADTSGNDLYLCKPSSLSYSVTLPDYTGDALMHKTDHKTITGWYRDDISYDDSTPKPSALDKRNGSRTLSVRDASMGLVACSTAYDIVFAPSSPSGSQAYRDPLCSETITSAAPGERVYLKCDADGSDTDSRMSLTVVTDGDSPISVPVTREGDNAYFIMPDTNIKQKVTVSLTVEYKVTVIGGYAGLMTRPTTAISYAKPGEVFCLRFNASGTFEKWVWDATKRPDNLSDDDSRNTKANYPRFTMPDHAVTVWAISEGNAYQVYVERPAGVDFAKSPVAVSVTGTAPDTQAAARAGTAVTSANAGQTVSLTFDPASLPDGCQKTFGSWTVTKKTDAENSGTESNAVTVAEPTSQTASFTMPASDVVVTFTLKDAGQTDNPGASDMPSDGGSGAGAVIAGAVIGTATYLVGTHAWLHHLYGFIPQNRIQLALALWKRADCPQPESTALYPDIDEDDDDAQAAARWCVEQGLMKDYHKTDKDGNEEVTFKPYRYVFRPQAIKAWYDLEKLLNEQQQSGT